MNSFASYQAVNTKLHARKKALLSRKEWQEAISFKSVTQVTDFLKKRPAYKKLVSEHSGEDLHRVDLEAVLERHIVKEIESMLHYFSGSYKEFFKTFLMEYEINDLQLLIRSISRNENMANIENFYVHSEKYGLSIYPKLASCKTITQFIEALKGTIYYEALRTMVQDDMAKREFHMEMKLYILFYRELMKTVKNLNQKDRRIARKMIGTRIDLINVQWIYRARQYYDISPEEILIYSLPFGYKITYYKLKNLCYTKNMDEFKKLCKRYLSFSIDEEDDTFLEHTIDKQVYQYAKKMAYDGSSIVASLAYIYTLYIEVQDLIALTEGIRYNLRENELKKYLVHII